MRPILLLKTGELAIANEFGPYEGLFANVLGGTELTVVDVRREDPPDDDWAGVIITGSPASTYDDEPWIARAEEFLRRSAARGTPLFGVCFGHQLLGQTFGGKVERSPKGFELGTRNVQLTAAGQADPLLGVLPAVCPVQMTHGDVVVDLPPGAVVLAENAHSPHQAFRLGESIWGVQFHPEFSVAVERAIIDAFFVRPRMQAFPDWSGDAATLHHKLREEVRETPQAPGCLQRFIEWVQTH